MWTLQGAMGRLTDETEIADAEKLQEDGFKEADLLNKQANELALQIQDRERAQTMKQMDYMSEDLND